MSPWDQSIGASIRRGNAMELFAAIGQGGALRLAVGVSDRWTAFGSGRARRAFRPSSRDARRDEEEVAPLVPRLLDSRIQRSLVVVSILRHLQDA